MKLKPHKYKYPAGTPITDFQVLGKTQKGANYRRFVYLVLYSVRAFAN